MGVRVRVRVYMFENVIFHVIEFGLGCGVDGYVLGCPWFQSG